MLPATIKNNREKDLYRTYVSECLRMITENTAKASSSGGRYMVSGLDELLNPKPKDKRTGDEIVADIVKGAGLKMTAKGGDEA